MSAVQFASWEGMRNLCSARPRHLVEPNLLEQAKMPGAPLPRPYQPHRTMSQPIKTAAYTLCADPANVMAIF